LLKGQRYLKKVFHEIYPPLFGRNFSHRRRRGPVFGIKKRFLGGFSPPNFFLLKLKGNFGGLFGEKKKIFWGVF